MLPLFNFLFYNKIRVMRVRLSIIRFSFQFKCCESCLGLVLGIVIFIGKYRKSRKYGTLTFILPYLSQPITAHHYCFRYQLKDTVFMRPLICNFAGGRLLKYIWSLPRRSSSLRKVLLEEFYPCLLSLTADYLPLFFALHISELQRCF